MCDQGIRSNDVVQLYQGTPTNSRRLLFSLLRLCQFGLLLLHPTLLIGHRCRINYIPGDRADRFEEH
jgi:hypothetical protein